MSWDRVGQLFRSSVGRCRNLLSRVKPSANRMFKNKPISTPQPGKDPKYSIQVNILTRNLYVSSKESGTWIPNPKAGNDQELTIPIIIPFAAIILFGALIIIGSLWKCALTKRREPFHEYKRVILENNFDSTDKIDKEIKFMLLNWDHEIGREMITEIKRELLESPYKNEYRDMKKLEARIRDVLLLQNLHCLVKMKSKETST